MGTDPRTVFVAMPFNDTHSPDLWDAIQEAGGNCLLNVVRADMSRAPNLILSDIWKGISMAGIIVVDLTGSNANVMYEVGFAHGLSRKPILICASKPHEGTPKLPFDLQGFRCFFFDMSNRESRTAFIAELQKVFEEAISGGQPVVLDSHESRTRAMIFDLQTLSRYPQSQLERSFVWLQASLSSFAFTQAEVEADELLKMERSLLLDLAERGCQVRCIIAPLRVMTFHDKDRGRRRAEALSGFLNSTAAALNHVEWAVSDFDESNMFIIGDVACHLGYKGNNYSRIGITLRLTGPHAISMQCALYNALFDRLSRDTVFKYLGNDVATYLGDRVFDPAETPRATRTAMLKESAIRCLGKFLKEFDVPLETSAG